MTAENLETVYQSLAADLRMLAYKTGLWPEDKCNSYLEDLYAFVIRNYLIKVWVILKDANGSQIRAREYDIRQLATDHKASRPGDNNWDEYDGNELSIIIRYGNDWDTLVEKEKKKFKSERNIPWSPTKENTTFDHLKKKPDRLYRSNDTCIIRIEYD